MGRAPLLEVHPPAESEGSAQLPHLRRDPDLWPPVSPRNDSILHSIHVWSPGGRGQGGTRGAGWNCASWSERKGCRLCQDASPQISSDNSHRALPGLACSCSHRPRLRPRAFLPTICRLPGESMSPPCFPPTGSSGLRPMPSGGSTIPPVSRVPWGQGRDCCLGLALRSKVTDM